MHWYGKPNTDRFEIRTPAGVKQSIRNHLLYHNRNGKHIANQTDFILQLISEALAPDAAAAEAYAQLFFSKNK